MKLCNSLSIIPPGAEYTSIVIPTSYVGLVLHSTTLAPASWITHEGFLQLPSQELV